MPSVRKRPRYFSSYFRKSGWTASILTPFKTLKKTPRFNARRAISSNALTAPNCFTLRLNSVRSIVHARTAPGSKANERDAMELGLLYYLFENVQLRWEEGQWR